ncbi:MAG: phosphopantothenoylcysteine decarboxylase [Candidatus Omnitrophota bacterium]|nr:phosphopantothenoylcysteine decarboxylase [Candidatus Omnitrophota bacterium]
MVTAGPTRERLDPVRYISNDSTGIMGYEIAAEAARQGFEVCLISGPVNLRFPPGVEVVNVVSAREMRDEVMARIADSDCLIMAAAVCDYRPEEQQKQKIKKNGDMTLKLVKNPDILLEMGQREGLIKVGFALETEDPVGNGRKKLKAKKLDLIIVNSKGPGEDPFGEGQRRYTIIDKEDNATETGKVTKKGMAKIIIGKVREIPG